MESASTTKIQGAMKGDQVSAAWSTQGSKAPAVHLGWQLAFWQEAITDMQACNCMKEGWIFSGFKTILFSYKLYFRIIFFHLGWVLGVAKCTLAFHSKETWHSMCFYHCVGQNCSPFPTLTAGTVQNQGRVFLAVLAQEICKYVEQASPPKSSMESGITEGMEDNCKGLSIYNSSVFLQGTKIIAKHLLGVTAAAQRHLQVQNFCIRRVQPASFNCSVISSLSAWRAAV